MHTTAKRPNALRKILLVDDSQLADALSTSQVTLTFGSAGKARVESLHQVAELKGSKTRLPLSLVQKDARRREIGQR